MFLQETEKLYIQPKKVEDIEILSNASKAWLKKSNGVLIEMENRATKACNKMECRQEKGGAGLSGHPKRWWTNSTNMVPGSKHRSESPATVQSRISRGLHSRQWEQGERTLEGKALSGLSMINYILVDMDT
jgi:hypothetical protein